MLKRLMKAEPLDIPMILVDRTLPGGRFDSVVIDNHQTATQLVEHLIATGRRRIAGLFGNSSSTGHDRMAGYCDTLNRHGLEVFAHPVRPYAQEAEKLFPEIWAQDRPDAIITSNSVLGSGLMRAVHNMGLKCPDDVALASFDDEPWTSLIEPGLTVVAQPVNQIGRDAMHLLFDRISDPGAPPRTVQLPGQLIARGSTAPTHQNVATPVPA